MKLRLRYGQSTKVLEIPHHLEDSFTVSDVLANASVLFTTDFEGDYNLSLNKKDPIGGKDEKIADCSIVFGDILHLVSTADETVPAKKQYVGDNREGSNLPKEANENIDNSDKPGTSSQTQGTSSNKNSSETVSTTNGQKNENIGTSPPGAANSVNSVQGEDKNGVDPNQHLCENETQDVQPNDMEQDTGEDVNHDIVNKCLSEPILCREASDGRVPVLLKEMVNSMQPKNETEAVCVVLHVLMLETGFMVKVASNDSSNIRDMWRFSGHYKFVYTYTGCTDVQCLLIVTTGLTLSLHGQVAGTDMIARQCSLKGSDYVQGDISDCEKYYHHLAKLSRTFKYHIANPLVQDIRTAAGLEDIYGILALPQEIKLQIFSFLGVQSLSKVCSVCQEFQDIAADPYLWRRLYLKHFGNRTDNSLSQNWKQMYKHEFERIRKMLNEFSNLTPLSPGCMFS